MNLRCFYCQTPFTLGTEEKITALKKMHAEDLHHYDAHCPRCGNFNLERISRERVEDGIGITLKRWLGFPAYRCDPCRHRFFSVLQFRRIVPSFAESETRRAAN